MLRFYDFEKEEWVDVPCFFCGGESVPRTCPGDGQRHHHGASHPPAALDEQVTGYVTTCANCHHWLQALWNGHWPARGVLGSFSLTFEKEVVSEDGEDSTYDHITILHNATEEEVTAFFLARGDLAYQYYATEWVYEEDADEVGPHVGDQTNGEIWLADLSVRE